MAQKSSAKIYRMKVSVMPSDFYHPIVCCSWNRDCSSRSETKQLGADGHWNYNFSSDRKFKVTFEGLLDQKLVNKIFCSGMIRHVVIDAGSFDE